MGPTPLLSGERRAGDDPACTLQPEGAVRFGSGGARAFAARPASHPLPPPPSSPRAPHGPAHATVTTPAFDTFPTGEAAGMQGPDATPAPAARGTGHRLWVHCPSIPEAILEEHFSAFGPVVDVYVPRDAQ